MRTNLQSNAEAEAHPRTLLPSPSHYVPSTNEPLSSNSQSQLGLLMLGKRKVCSFDSKTFLHLFLMTTHWESTQSDLSVYVSRYPEKE